MSTLDNRNSIVGLCIWCCFWACRCACRFYLNVQIFGLFIIYCDDHADFPALFFIFVNFDLSWNWQIQICKIIEINVSWVGQSSTSDLAGRLRTDSTYSSMSSSTDTSSVRWILSSCYDVIIGIIVWLSWQSNSHKNLHILPILCHTDHTISSKF